MRRGLKWDLGKNQSWYNHAMRVHNDYEPARTRAAYLDTMIRSVVVITDPKRIQLRLIQIFSREKLLHLNTVTLGEATRSNTSFSILSQWVCMKLVRAWNMLWRQWSHIGCATNWPERTWKVRLNGWLMILLTLCSWAQSWGIGGQPKRPHTVSWETNGKSPPPSLF